MKILSKILASVSCLLLFVSSTAQPISTFEVITPEEYDDFQYIKVTDEYLYTLVPTYIYDECGNPVFVAEAGTKVHIVHRDLTNNVTYIEVEDDQFAIENKRLSAEAPEQEAKDLELQLLMSQFPRSDLRYMTSIIYVESGNQCVAGQQAIGIVVMNRVKSDYCPDNIEGVLYQDGQFYPRGAPRFEWALNLYDTDQIPVQTIEAACYALQGNTTIEYQGETYDLNDYLFFATYWKNSRLQIQDVMFK